ncbi:MAG: hypothetical protein LBQ20_03215 [Rhodanobacter sp.]|nr:hypothetical protein [Rhodanobacter sp.]
MKLKEDIDTFDNWQSYFSYEILRTIKDAIKEELGDTSLSEEQIKELTASIGFNVSCLLDASATFSVDGTQITPVLTFTTDRELLVHQGGPTNLHEYVYGSADELFGE